MAARLRVGKSGTPEGTLVKAALLYLRSKGILAWRQNAGAFSGTYKGKRRFFRAAYMPGISDIIGVLPGSGRILCAEAKVKPRKPTPEQLVFLEAVRGQGGLAVVFYSVDELMDAIEWDRATDMELT